MKWISGIFLPNRQEIEVAHLVSMSCRDIEIDYRLQDYSVTLTYRRDWSGWDISPFHTRIPLTIANLRFRACNKRLHGDIVKSRALDQMKYLYHKGLKGRRISYIEQRVQDPPDVLWKRGLLWKQHKTRRRWHLEWYLYLLLSSSFPKRNIHRPKEDSGNNRPHHQVAVAETTLAPRSFDLLLRSPLVSEQAGNLAISSRGASSPEVSLWIMFSAEVLKFSLIIAHAINHQSRGVRANHPWDLHQTLE